MLEETMDSVLSIEEAFLYVAQAKEVVRKEILQETKESVLSPKESKQNPKLAKEAARKTVTEMKRSEEYKTAARASNPQQSNKKEEVAETVTLETRQDSEDVTLQLPTPKEVEAKPTAPLPWYYTDLQHRIQGPYSRGQMRHWLEGGYIQNDLPLSHSCDGPFQELSTYYPDINKAFTCSLEMTNESNGVENKAVDSSQKQSNDESVLPPENKKWEYAVNSDGSSTFEGLWKKRTTEAADNKDEEPHYQFFNGQCSKVVTKLGNGINEQDDSRHMEEDSQEFTLWECDVSGCTATFNTYEEAVEHELTCKKRSQQDDSK